MKNEYEPVIGLEIHAELNTRTKMFCGCLNDANERHPNINICPICMGHPGTLPVINSEAIKKVICIGAALQGEVSAFSQFDRKQYFYPDLPKGYQISQYKFPIVQGGHLELRTQNLELGTENPARSIRLTRIHLEEDAGRLLHARDGSLVDFNRAGVPLMELVTEPDIRSAGEARAFAEELQLLLRYTGVSDADMEKGEMRIEANVSLHKPSEPYGTKVEVKNINSFKAVEKAIKYEIERQAALLEEGKKVVQETRGWDDEKEITVSQRIKEEANDYRYFPEPDLPPLAITQEMVEEARKKIPELPQEKRKRFFGEFGIPTATAEILIVDKRIGAFFENSISELAQWMREKNISSDETKKGVQLLVNYLTSDLTKLLRETSASIDESRITPENFAELISLLLEKKITSYVAKTVLGEMFRSGADPTTIIEEKNLGVSDDRGAIDASIENAIQKSEKAVSDYKNGKQEALQFLVGQVMKELRGRANPETIREELIKKLSR